MDLRVALEEGVALDGGDRSAVVLGQIARDRLELRGAHVARGRVDEVAAQEGAPQRRRRRRRVAGFGHHEARVLGRRARLGLGPRALAGVETVAAQTPTQRRGRGQRPRRLEGVGPRPRQPRRQGREGEELRRVLRQERPAPLRQQHERVVLELGEPRGLDVGLALVRLLCQPGIVVLLLQHQDGRGLLRILFHQVRAPAVRAGKLEGAAAEPHRHEPARPLLRPQARLAAATKAPRREAQTLDHRRRK